MATRTLSETKATRPCRACGAHTEHVDVEVEASTGWALSTICQRCGETTGLQFVGWDEIDNASEEEGTA